MTNTLTVNRCGTRNKTAPYASALSSASDQSAADFHIKPLADARLARRRAPSGRLYDVGRWITSSPAGRANFTAYPFERVVEATCRVRHLSVTPWGNGRKDSRP